jgi:hypothetical protein
VDAEQREGLSLQWFHERPLVRPIGPSGGSELGPEVEQHDLATVVAQQPIATMARSAAAGLGLPTIELRTFVIPTLSS